jgi:hypothetical protein
MGHATRPPLRLRRGGSPDPQGRRPQRHPVARGRAGVPRSARRFRGPLTAPRSPEAAITHSATSRRPGPGSADLLLAGVGGAALCGLLLGRLTLGLNLHFYETLREPFALLAYFALGYTLVGAALGLLGAAALSLLRVTGLPRGFVRALGIAGVSGLLLGPLVYYALLPDVGLQHGFLSGLIFGASKPRLLASLAGLTIGFAAVGWLLAPIVRAAGRSLGTSTRGFLVRAYGLAGLAVVVAALGLHPRPPAPDTAAPAALGALALPDSRPPRVVLLCIDGADLDDMIQPMVDAGELPTFARLMRDGTWGPLATIEPTLSAVVWTTIITGKTPDQHGIRHFIVFRLPGLRKAIHQFPRHTGLNFRVFPMLEKLPGMPSLQAPYTSNMRTAEALWNIAGRVAPVGAYRWLVTWPVEPLNGFNVAGGVGWLQIMGSFEEDAGRMLEQGFHSPRDVYAALPQPPAIPDVTRAMLEPYVGAGHEVSASDWKMKAVAAALRDPTGHWLPRLIDKYDALFTAASFYPVDEFCHYFTVYRGKGGVFSNAVAEKYRDTDRRLGEFLAAVGDSVNVVLVSDHGYDFAQNHHTDAPAGVFFGVGPAFAAGQRVAGLGVYDVAPLCLALLGLPLADDMPGTATRAFETALAPAWRAGAPPDPPRVATYETGERLRAVDPIASPIDEQIKEQLKSLGYIN